MTVTPETAARLAEAVRLLLAELKGRAVDRQMATAAAREALQDWDKEQTCAAHGCIDPVVYLGLCKPHATAEGPT